MRQLRRNLDQAQPRAGHRRANPHPSARTQSRANPHSRSRTHSRNNPHPRNNSQPRSALILACLLAALAFSVVAAILIGPAEITLHQVWQVVTGNTSEVSPSVAAIIWQGRIPRVLGAAIVGAGLAIAGVVMQSLTSNPLADPYLLGISSGAGVGAVTALVAGMPFLLIPSAFVGATLALTASLLIATAGRVLSPSRSVLAGLAVAQLGSATTSVLIFWHASGDSYREILTWLLGSLAGVRWSDVTLAGVVLLVAGWVVLLQGHTLDAFAFGDDAAAALGIAVNRTRWLLFGVVALLTAALVAISGAIGFVGLILPHAVRYFSGARHQLLLPSAALAGAVFLVWADTLARTVFDPRELPVGAVTALIGVPVFIVLLRARGGWR